MLLGHRPLTSARVWPGDAAENPGSAGPGTAWGTWWPSGMNIETHHDEGTSSFQAGCLGTALGTKTLADPSFSGSLSLSHQSSPAFLAQAARMSWRSGPWAPGPQARARSFSSQCPWDVGSPINSRPRLVCLVGQCEGLRGERRAMSFPGSSWASLWNSSLLSLGLGVAQEHC